MKPVNNETIVRQLNWRYATKRFDPDRNIAAPDWRTLEQALVLSPSSYGLQPWKFFVIRDPAVRARLGPAAWNQSQITDASHLVAFAVRRDFGAQDVDRYIARIAEVRKLPAESLAAYREMMLQSVSRPREEVQAWASRQIYIALGTFLSAAAMLGIDACPMEGFDAQQFDQILGLGEQGYHALVLATAGYRASDDAYAKLPKVRFAPDEIIANVA